MNPNNPNTSVYLPTDLRQKVDEAARNDGRTRSGFIRRALESAVTKPRQHDSQTQYKVRQPTVVKVSTPASPGRFTPLWSGGQAPGGGISNGVSRDPTPVFLFRVVVNTPGKSGNLV